VETLAAPPNLQTANFSPLAATTLGVSPNPVRDGATISYSLPAPARISLKLYDVTGKLLTLLTQGFRNRGTSSFTLQPATLARGVYLLRLDTGSQTVTSKLIIE
jgi:hypothetical protein